MCDTAIASLKLTAVVAAFAVATSCGRAGQSAPNSTSSARVDSLIAGLLRSDGPGAAVLVVADGKVVHQKGYGLANLSTRAPITPGTTFDLASVSKQFTAMAIMILAERGQLKYSDSLTRFFPEFPAYASRITVRHLLTHTSGLPDYMDVYRQRADGSEPSSRDVAGMIASVDTPYFAPGRKFEYSNSAYVLLAQIVEKVSGMPFPEFMRANVFDPLGMSSTMVSDQIKAPSPNRAVSYDSWWMFGWRYRDDDYTPLNRIYGDGNVNTSLEDMARWVGALCGESLVKQATLAEAFEPMRLNDGKSSPYGFGWRLLEWDGQRVFQHGGAWAGFRSNIVLVPPCRLTVVVLSNSKLFKVAEAAQEITRYYLENASGPR